MSDDQSEPASAAPVLRIVKGDPTPDELAALVAVIAARRAAAANAESAASRQRRRSEWGHPARQHRRPLRVGPGQWRASAW